MSLKMSNFVKEIRDVITNDNIETMRDDIFSMIENLLSKYAFTYAYINYLQNVFWETLLGYRDAGYHFIPLDYRKSIEELGDEILAFIKLRINENVPILSLYNYTEEDGVKSDFIPDENEENIRSFEGKEERAGESGSNSADENSPISAAIDTLNNPSFKRKSNETTTGTIDKSDTETFSHSKSSPYYYEKYIDLSIRYNIHRIFENIIKVLVWEYNYY